MTSPAYSELPQELLLDVDPIRPATYKYDHCILWNLNPKRIFNSHANYNVKEKHVLTSVVIMGGDKRTTGWNCCHFPRPQSVNRVKDGKMVDLLKKI